MTIPSPRYGRVLVTVEKEFEDEVKVGDTTLALDPSYQPLHHVAEFGTVLAPPTSMPEWAPTPCEVRAGERVRFKYLAICPANEVPGGVDGQRAWLVPYSMLYYVERPDGTVRLLNHKVLVTPILTEGGEEKTASGLITNLDVKARARPVAQRGTLRHAFADCPLPLGCELRFYKDADVEMEVGGETLYLMDYLQDLLAST